jgi:RimJ/RimL family protein N-acetyltransferase
MELSFSTDRLVVRAMTEADVPAVVAYRNDPAVAEHQDWELPVTAHDMPRSNRIIALGAEVVGDLYVSVDGRLATIGYTLAREHQRKGYAVEAVGAAVDHLFDNGVHRIEAMTDPKNFPSMVVLERVGFRYEGRKRQSTFVRGEWLDDELFGLVAPDRAEWLARPEPPAVVELAELTAETCIAVARLQSHKSQEQFLSPTWMSTQFNDEEERLTPWCRAVVADGVPVGFVMCAEPTPLHDEWYLWRFLIDRAHQRRGIGTRAMRALFEHLRSIGATALETSWVPERGGPAPFYRSLGFAETGDLEDDEVVARLLL